jgi:hypothetical protein
VKSLNETLTGDMVNWRSRLWDAEEQIEQMRVQMARMTVDVDRKEEDAGMDLLRKELTTMHKTVATYEEALGQMVRVEVDELHLGFGGHKPQRPSSQSPLSFSIVDFNTVDSEKPVLKSPFHFPLPILLSTPSFPPLSH